MWVHLKNFINKFVIVFKYIPFIYSIGKVSVNWRHLTSIFVKMTIFDDRGLTSMTSKASKCRHLTTNNVKVSSNDVKLDLVLRRRNRDEVQCLCKVKNDLMHAMSLYETRSDEVRRLEKVAEAAFSWNKDGWALDAKLFSTRWPKSSSLMILSCILEITEVRDIVLKLEQRVLCSFFDLHTTEGFKNPLYLFSRKKNIPWF